MDSNLKHQLRVLTLMSLAGSGVEGNTRSNPWTVKTGSPGVKVEAKPKHPFTEEEREKLATLGGKAKRKYLKELKEKYS